VETTAGLSQASSAGLEITRRVLGSSAIVFQEPDESDISVRLDVESLLVRLLLFDTYILYSVRLKEIPELVRHFGYAGTLALLSSGALEIRCECAQFVEGQFSTPACPLFTFQFHVVEAHIRDQYVIDNLSNVNRSPGLSARELMVLQGAIMKAVRQPDNRQMFSSRVAPAFEADVLHNSPLLRAAVRFVLAKEKGISHTADFNLRFHQVGPDRYEAETSLATQLSLSPQDLHNVIKSALLAVGGVDQRLGEMEVHTALSGFTDEELPLFRSKLASLVDAVGSQQNEGRFQRVVSITGLPEFPAEAPVDIEKLLEVRRQPEAIEFRGWLSGIDQLSDVEIGARVSSLNAKLGLAVQRRTGKLLRVLVQIAAGLIPGAGLTLGPAASALDQFVWDRFFRRSGVAAFVHELYPSIFRAR
jgi:hypothetical protein